MAPSRCILHLTIQRVMNPTANSNHPHLRLSPATVHARAQSTSLHLTELTALHRPRIARKCLLNTRAPTCPAYYKGTAPRHRSIMLLHQGRTANLSVPLAHHGTLGLRMRSSLQRINRRSASSRMARPDVVSLPTSAPYEAEPPTTWIPGKATSSVARLRHAPSHVLLLPIRIHDRSRR